MATPAPEALFVPDGDLVVPTDLARGPWDLGALHGGPVAAVLARAAERTESDVAMQLARLTVELLRPVPVAALAIGTRVVRPGRKVQLVEVTVEAGDQQVARAIALRIRTANVTVPESATTGTPPGPEDGVEGRSSLTDPDVLRFHSHGVEIRFVSGQFDDPGPATAWFRLRHPVVADEEPTPWMRAAAAADFGNGISRVLEFERHLFINPDLTIHLHRAPVGEWVCLEAATAVQPTGVGMAESRLYDRSGPIGRSVQSLLVDSR
jgi:hypothetical protein